jgi:hypothetical protein
MSWIFEFASNWLYKKYFIKSHYANGYSEKDPTNIIYGIYALVKKAGAFIQTIQYKVAPIYFRI